jgi:signal transduction histidine kinase
MTELPRKLSLVGSSQKQKSDGPSDGFGKRLPDFIRENSEEIVREWENFARGLICASPDMSPLALRDHIEQILEFVVEDIESPQSGLEQIEKSQGKKHKSAGHSAAETHAALRLAGGFEIDQMVSEYRALRASVIKLWSAANKEVPQQDLIDLTRFSESIDQELGESVSHYTKEVNHAKHLFLGILGHDLRTPLGVVSASADLLTRLGPLNERQTMLVAQIAESSARTMQIVSDLLDVTRARFGSGLPINRASMDMDFVARQLVNEMLITYPSRNISLKLSGNMKGEWDKARIGQIFSNLIGNAIQYSFADTTINIRVDGSSDDEIVLTIQNEGLPIPDAKIGTIFDPLSRAVSDRPNEGEAQNLGLGLYITKDIVVSHRGTISVSSSEEGGTNFIVHLPRSV